MKKNLFQHSFGFLLMSEPFLAMTNLIVHTVEVLPIFHQTTPLKPFYSTQ
nr:MAG TPA: hypothetical protein [Caudoviricetes sp.]